MVTIKDFDCTGFVKHCEGTNYFGNIAVFCTLCGNRIWLEGDNWYVNRMVYLIRELELELAS